MNFFGDKNQQPINLDNVETFVKTEVSTEVSPLYFIKFYTINNNYWWKFETKDERDQSYNNITRFILKKQKRL